MAPAARAVREIAVTHPLVRCGWAILCVAGGIALLFVPTLFMLRVFGFLGLLALAAVELVKVARTRKLLNWAGRYLDLH